MSTPLIKTVDAWKIYRVGDVEIPAVRGVSLTIDHGQFVAITGVSGSGKSTFMYLLGCLGRLTRGTYELDGQPVDQLDNREQAALRNRRIGFVFQNFNLMGRTTVLDNVALPLAYQGVPLRERRQRSEEMLVRVGLADRVHHHPNQLSGGQQQRVAIARALVTKPSIIFADEPTGNLDSKTGEQLMNLFVEVNQEEHVAVVVVTHEIGFTAFAQRHIVFSDGQVIADSGGNGRAQSEE